MTGDREHKFVNLSFKCFVTICIINSSLLFPIYLSTGLNARADGSIDTATKSNDIKFDPNGSGRIKALDGDGKGKLDGREAPEDICSVYHQVCSIHYSLSILGYSLLNYESKPVLSTNAIPTSSTRASDDSNNNPRESKKEEEDALFMSENPTHCETTEPEHEKGKRTEDQVMNKISSNDKPGSLHEYSPPSSKKEERLSEEYKNIDKVIEVKEERKLSCEKDKRMEHKEEELQRRRTYSSPSSTNGYPKRLHGNSFTLSTLLEAITSLFDSFFSWSFCTFALVLYFYMIKEWSKKEQERMGENLSSSRRSHNNHPVLNRSKSTVSGDLIQNRTVEVEAVKGENEQDDFNEASIHAILNEILMKVHMMDSKLELVMNGLLRVLLIWKTLIKEVFPDDDNNQKNENEQKNGKHESNSDNDEASSINQRNEKFQNLVEEEGLFGQSILDTSDSQLVPDFSSDEEGGEADMDVEEETETEDGGEEEEEVHSADFEYGME